MLKFWSEVSDEACVENPLCTAEPVSGIGKADDKRLVLYYLVPDFCGEIQLQPQGSLDTI
jgi:hypothetical protein